MKKSAVALVVLMGLCTGWAQDKEVKEHSKGDKKGSKMAAKSDNSEAVIRSLWESFKNKDSKTFASLITEDALMADPRGVEDKSGVMKDLNSCSVNSFTLSDFKEIKADKDATVVSYHVAQDGTCAGEKMADHIVASDVLVKRAGKWQSIYHQETPMPKM